MLLKLCNNAVPLEAILQSVLQRVCCRLSQPGALNKLVIRASMVCSSFCMLQIFLQRWGAIFSRSWRIRS